MPANRFRRRSTWLFWCNPYQGLPSIGEAITSPSWTTTSSAIALQAFSPAESAVSASKKARVARPSGIGKQKNTRKANKTHIAKYRGLNRTSRRSTIIGLTPGPPAYLRGATARSVILAFEQALRADQARRHDHPRGSRSGPRVAPSPADGR